MAVDTALTPSLTLRLDDDLAGAPARGVERAVDDASLREAADLLLVAPSALRDVGTDVWLLRSGAHALSALVAERDADTVAITAIAATHVEPLLRAVLGHYALEGAQSATVAAPGGADGALRRLGFRPLS